MMGSSELDRDARWVGDDGAQNRQGEADPIVDLTGDYRLCNLRTFS